MRALRLFAWVVGVAALAAVGPAEADGNQESDKTLTKAEKERLEKERKKRAAYREKRLRERILTARDLERTVSPFVPDITACYKKHGTVHKRATGVVQLEVLVEPGGKLRRLYVIAPGVRGKKLKNCITKISRAWTFPTRKGFTKATIPFRFLQTKAKGAGPLRSCWSAKGCSKRRAKAKKPPKKTTTKKTAPKKTTKKTTKKGSK